MMNSFLRPLSASLLSSLIACSRPLSVVGCVLDVTVIIMEVDNEVRASNITDSMKIYQRKSPAVAMSLLTLPTYSSHAKHANPNPLSINIVLDCLYL